MDFVHDLSDQKETIAAIATPLGEGGIAVIRISGREALSILGSICSKKITSKDSHKVFLTKICDKEGNAIDTCLIIPMLNGKSYTGEDVVEVQSHGGALISKKVLHCILEAGARPAKPGEFTLRAFLNGKMDLTQAEAVQNLIHAKNEKALAVAEQHLRGTLKEKILFFQKKLNRIAAILNAWIDFPEEGIEFASMESVIEEISFLMKEIEGLLATYKDGKVIQQGLSLALIGAPNNGKSSLMNALLKKERAIVSNIPGTTRDTVEENIHLRGLHFRLLDTAGIRETEEEIEKEGIRRSKIALEEADLILFLLDASLGVSLEEEELLKTLSKDKTVLVWNKKDLQEGPFSSYGFSFSTAISAKKKEGIEDLLNEIEKVIWQKGPPSQEEVLITSERHERFLKEALFFLKALKEGLEQEMSPEFLTMDMRYALISLGKIIGRDITEDILSEIFSTFCIGK